mmetsp:Transcript_4472/g.11222  ORF Transcript_4472/g.11222 Transcript_4472/m.11222 type:complete len:1333 (-) Transcript_4472:294-4292(-)
MAPPAAAAEGAGAASSALAAPRDASKLFLFVNNKEYSIPSGKVDPEMTLLTFLRNNGLTGTKLGCGEGGCGACTVTVSNFDAIQDKIVHKAVNACIAPVCAMDGCHILTVEGIGSTDTAMHPVQQRLADCHGSQCGYCTPGFVMSMYSLLRNKPTPSVGEVEHCLDGNLCRCTGYRPILDAFKTFCKKEGEEAAPAPKEGEVPSYWDKAEPVLPEALKSYKAPSLVLAGQKSTWFRPTTLTEMLAIKQQYPTVKVVAGNTELEIERKFRGSSWQALVCPSHVPELNALEVRDNGVYFGAATTLSRVKDCIDGLIKTMPAEKTHNFKAMTHQMQWFAGTQIRNVGCVGGNVANASPISDLNPVLMSNKCMMTMAKVDGTTREMLVRDFFKERAYRQTHLGPDEIILGFFVPYTETGEIAEGYKTSRRRDDDIAIVTAGLRVRLEKEGGAWVAKDAGFAYGGMAASTINCKRAEAYVTGKPWTKETIEGALKAMAEDLPLEKGAPGGMIEYRRTLCSSFLMKFYVFVLGQVDPSSVPKDEATCAVPYSRPESKGLQHFKETNKNYLPDPEMGPFRVQDGVGSAVKHAAADIHCTGEAQYTDDIPNPMGGLYAGLVLSSKPHARILSVDPAPALALEGVVAFFDHKDVDGSNKHGAVIYDEEVFSSEKVTCVGLPIGVVVAETQLLARKAASLVKVTYEELPHIISIEDAIKNDSFIGDECKIESGDVDAAMTAPGVKVVEGENMIGGQEHFYLETNATLVVPGEKNEFTVYTSSQNPSKTSNFVASALGIEKNRVVCKMKRMGGGFGGKETRSVFIAMCVAVAAKKLRKPVRISLDRDQDMCITGQRHPFKTTYKCAYTPDGKIVAVDVKLWSNGGMSLDLSRPVLERALFHVENSYGIPNVRVRGRVCRTNLPSNTAFRGFGGPQGIVACEIYIDHVARELGLNPDVVREKNLYTTKGAVTPYGQLLVDCHTREMWAELKESSEYEVRRTAVDKFNTENKWVKRGLSMVPVKFGMSFTAKFMNQASALVHIYTDGTVLVSHGGTEMGQGLHTKMSQIAATELGVPLNKVYISETATDKCANTLPTAASVGADLNGFAVQDACKQINQRLMPLRVKMPNATMAELALAAWLERVDLSAHGFYKTPDVGFNFETQEGKPFHYFAYGIACTEVEVDVLTGDFTVLRTDILHDVGDSLNPVVDVGQVEGGFVQGLGLFTLEEMVWMNNGQLFTRGPSTYKIPSANDIPIDFRVKLFADAPNRRTIFSSKGVGEPPLNLAISVYAAIKDAIYAARKDNGLSGHFRLDTPATGERIRLACGDPLLRQFAPTDVLAAGSW